MQSDVTLPEPLSGDLQASRPYATAAPASQSVLMLAARPRVRGPIPKITPLQIVMLEAQGYSVDVAYWGSRFDDEPMWRKWVAGPLDIAKVLKALKSGSHGVLFVNTAHDVKALLRDIPLLYVTRRRGLRRILLLHGSLAERLVHPGRRLFKLASRILTRNADAVLVLSTAELEMWRSFEPRGHYFHVSNPFVPGSELREAAIARQAASDAPRERREIIFVGRLMVEKGVVDLLEAMRLVNDKLPCRLVIAGTGPLQDRLRTLTQEYGLGDCIDLRGYMDAADLAKAYASAEIMVLPTYWDEGFPTVIAEAMSVGLPVITTRIRGAADLLKEGENCLFVPPQDPVQLAARILALLGDDGLARRMSVANRALVESFTPSAVGAAYAHAFASPVGTREPRR